MFLHPIFLFTLFCWRSRILMIYPSVCLKISKSFGRKCFASGVLVKAQLLKYTWKELTTKNEKPKLKKFSFFAQYLDFPLVLSNRFPRAQYYTGCTLQLSVWSKWPHPFLHRYLKCSSAAVLRPYLECIVCHRLSCCERRSIGRPRSEEEERTDRGDLSKSFVNLTDNSLPFVNQSLCFVVLLFTL